jgi:hypothetical protein
MSVRNIFTLAISLSLLLLLALSSQATTKDHLPYPTEPIWTGWDAQRYDLADDGQSIWIAAAGGIIRWDKQTSTAHYITTLDGLPHSDVFAVAVDPDGNRWFGGDAGLSRLDPSGAWTHYDAANSDLPDGPIDAIAVAANGTLWLSHGLPDGALSQRLPDGAITWYPNRETAIVQAYEQIKETLNANDMWAVFGDEIWVGYRVFDGMTWQERLPPDGDVRTDHPIVRAASNAVYTLEPGNVDVFVWNGANWASYYLYTSFDSAGVALAVGPDDSAWVAWFAKYSPYTGGSYGVSRLPEEPGDIEMEHYVSSASAPPSALLATAEGLWGLGPGWLLQPDWTVSRGEDGPASDYVAHAILTTEGTLFVQSGPFVQTMEDRGTTIFDDDRWAIAEHVAQNVTAVERLPDGDLWVAGYDNTRIYFDNTYRYHQGAWISFPLSIEFPVYDIFAENARITWFAYANIYGSVVARGVKRLDDGGTPADLSDDVWTDYPIDSPGQLQHLAVDGLGRIWATGDADLYLHDGNAWQPYLSDKSGSQICDMVPLDDGTLILQRSYSCERPFDYVPNYLVIHPDGLSEQTALDDLVQEEFERIVNTPHRNRLWTVAPDGAVWYMAGDPAHLTRYDGIQATTVDLPFQYYDYQGGPLEVDDNNHLWLVNDGLLWRLSPTPGFALDPQAWLLPPGSSRQRTLTVHSISGYSSAVTVSLDGLPPGITAAFQPNPFPAGESTQLTLTVDPTVTPGTYTATLEATDGDRTQSAPFTIIIAPTVHDLYAPLAARPGS